MRTILSSTSQGSKTLSKAPFMTIFFDEESAAALSSSKTNRQKWSLGDFLEPCEVDQKSCRIFLSKMDLQVDPENPSRNLVWLKNNFKKRSLFFKYENCLICAVTVSPCPAVDLCPQERTFQCLEK